MLKRFFYIIVLLSLCINVTAAGRALFQVPFGTPVIDGKDTEKAWKRATTLRNFLTLNGNNFAKEATTVKICRDDKNIYFFFKMDSFVLKPLSNQIDSFKAKIKERDGNVWSDNSIEMRLEKQNGGFPIYIAFNANGAILDMKYNAGGWDKKFNLPIKIKAGKGDGVWFAEMSLPLNSLSTDNNFEKSKWNINFIRFNQNPKETSSWVYLNDVNHMNMAHHGIMRFAKRTAVPITLKYGLKDIEAGKIPFKVIGTYPKGVLWLCRVYKGKSVIASKTEKSPKKDFFVILPETKNNGNYRFQFYVYDSSARGIFASPLYPCSSSKTKMTFALRADTALGISHNGKEIRLGETDLNVGANDIEITVAANSKITGSVSCQGKIYLIDKTWHIKKDKGKVIYNKTFVVRGTSFLPIMTGGEWQLTRNGTYTLIWDGSGINGRLPENPVKNMAMIIEVPNGIEFLGASYVKYPLTGTKNKTGEAPLSPELYTWQKIDSSGGYTKYKIKVNYPVNFVNKKETWLNRVQRRDKACYLAFKATGKLGETKAIKYYYYAENKNIVELPNDLKCRILPELKAKTPKKISIFLKTDSLDLADENIVKKYFDTLKSAGVNEIFANCHIAYPKEIGVEQLSYFNLSASNKYTFTPSVAAMDELFEKFPEAQGHWGKRKRFGVDPSYVTRTPDTWPYIEKAMIEAFKRTPGANNIFWDYEFSPFPGHIQMYPCFSDKGIKAFATKYDIKEKLSRAIIQKEYQQEWIDFSCSEVANLVKLVQKIANKHNRKLYLYSGYQNCKNGKEYYNIDWTKVGPYVDRAYCGYGRNMKLISDTKACLKGKPLAGGLLKMGSTAQANTPAQMLRKIIDCGNGVLLWYECRFDGKALSQIAKAANLVVKFEQVLLNGKCCDNIIIAPAKDSIAAYKLNGKLTIFLLNERSSGKQKVQFNLKGIDTVLTQYGTNKRYSTTKAISVEIPSGGVIVLNEKS